MQTPINALQGTRRERRGCPACLMQFIRRSMKLLVLSLVAMAIVGCTPTWEKTPAPDIHGTNGLASVIDFVATNGWNSYAETNYDIFWEDLEPKFYISDLPWKKWSGQQFQALTREGIL